MIKVAYLPNWEYQEVWLPVLFFQKTLDSNNWFNNLINLLNQLSVNNIAYNLKDYPNYYDLIDINNVIFESKSDAKILSKIDSNWNFIVSLDQKYWKILLKVIMNVNGSNSWHYYSDDWEMVEVIDELQNDITMIFDSNPNFINLSKHFE